MERTAMASETSFLACKSPPRLVVLWHIYILYLLLLCFRNICLFCQAAATGEAKVISTTSGHGHEYSLYNAGLAMQRTWNVHSV